MKSPLELFAERKNRIETAVNLGKPDRVPFVFIGDGFCANHMGVKLSDFALNPALSNKTILDSVKELGEIDGLGVTVCYPDVFSFPTLSYVRVAGRDLPESQAWQVDEQQLMTVEDYDFILNKGWQEFFGMYATTRLNNLFARLAPLFEFVPKDAINTVKAGLVPFCPINGGTPFDMLSGGRTMAKFMQDLFRMPDKVQTVMDIIAEALIAQTRSQIKAAKPFSVWIGGARCSGTFLSPKLWERFSWPYIVKLAEAVIDEGAYAYLHFDGDWSRDLEYFRQLPKGKCILGIDGTPGTDIRRAKEILGDMMCLYGDVPPSLLTLGTPDEVYDYCTKLIRDIGPSGFILAAGCGVPHNAKVENVKAMIAAAAGK